MKKHFFLSVIFSALCMTNLFSQCLADAGTNNYVCQGDTTTLNGISTGTGSLTYSWHPSAGLSCNNCPNPNAFPQSTTTYILSITDSVGCVSSDTIIVAVQTPPDSTFVFLPNNVCATTPVAFSANNPNNGINYSWDFGNPASGTSNTSTFPNAIHTFVSYGSTNEVFNVTLTVSDIHGCYQGSTTQQVTINSLPNASLIDIDDNFMNCNEESTFAMTAYDASAFPGTNYQIIWGDGTTDYNSPNPPVVISHTYASFDVFEMKYIVTGVNGCIDTARYFISNISNPGIGVANPGSTIGCGPKTLCFPLSGYSSNHSSTVYYINYGDGSPIDTIMHANLPAQICHTYVTPSCGQDNNSFTFEVQAQNQCDVSQATINPIRIFTAPVPLFDAPLQACVNTSVTFMNNTIAGYNSSCQESALYQWDFGDGTITSPSPIKTNPVHVYSAPGTYTVTLYTSNACTDNPLSYSKIICIEDIITPNFTVTPGTSCVPFTANVANNSDTTNVCQYSINWQMTAYSTSCPATQSWSFANGTNLHSWEPDFTFQSAGAYTMQMSMQNSCGIVYKDTIITAKDIPQIYMPPLNPLCKDESTLPSISVNDCYDTIVSYSWNFPTGSPATSNSLTPGAISFHNAGNYTIFVDVTNSCGVDSASTSLNVYNPPVANTGPDTSFCSGNSVTIGSPPDNYVTYLWSPSANLSSPNQSSVVANPTNSGSSPINLQYVLNASFSPTCYTQDTINITVNPLPDLSVNQPVICFGDTVQLIATSSTSPINFNWTPHPDLSCVNCDTSTVSPNVTTNYTITATNQYGCNSNAQSTVTVNPLPIVSAGGDQVLCDQPTPVQFNGTPIGGTWSGSPNLSFSGIFTPNGNENVNVVYAYLDPNTGCDNSDTINVIVAPPVVPTFQQNVKACINEGVIHLDSLFLPNPFGGTWSGGGVSGSNFNPQTVGVGLHSVTYTYGTGTCQIISTIDITVQPAPTITSNSGTICMGDTINLVASGVGVGGGYQWSPPTGLSCTTCDSTTANPTSTTTYTIIGTNSFSCSDTTTSTVTVNPLPFANAGNDTTLCNQPIGIQLVGTIPGGTWSGANVTPPGVFTPSSLGAFVVVYTVVDMGTGCTNADSITVTVVSGNIADAGIDQEACIANSSILVVGTPPGGSWSGINVDLAGNFAIDSAGVFSLVYTNGSGNCLTKDTMLFSVHPLPNVVAGSDTGVCISNTPITFVGSPVGGVFSGSGITNGSLGIFSPTVAGIGPHTITYTYTDPVTGCVNNDSLTATVHPLPTVDFHVDTVVCLNTNVQFTNLSTMISQSNWSFGDGGTSTNTHPIHSYSGSGVYSIQLIVSTQYGCSDSIVKTTNVTIPPTVNFQVSPDSLCGPLTANFLNNSSGPNVIYIWDFGNGATSNVINPNPVTYPSGIFADTSYTITLTVSNYCGQVSQQETITVLSPPTAVFGTDFDSFCAPWNPNFANSSYGIPNSFYWDFGNGTTSNIGDSLFQLPIYTPDTTTNYTIMLIAENACGSDTAYHTITVTPQEVTAFFNTSTTEGCLPLTVNFTQYYLGGTNYNWDLGDGNSSSSFSTTHTYQQAGTYYVSLAVNNGCGFDTSIVTINVYDVPGLSFNFQPDSACANTLIQFTNTSTPMQGYSWDFGDGDSSELFNPTHSYSSQGSYTVTLNGTSINGTCANSFSKQVHVANSPNAELVATPQIGCVPLNVQFNNLSTGNIYSTLYFGDGNTSTQASVQHLYSTPGVYTAQLIVQSINGCQDTSIQYINANPSPTVDFSIQPSFLCGLNQDVQINNLSIGAVDYQWSFGDGTSSTLVNPNPHTYQYTGNYPISLIASNAFGCSDTVIKEIPVNPVPIPDFQSLNSGCENTDLILHSTSSFSDSIVWNFGDGTFGFGETVHHQYENAGVYYVTISAYNHPDCFSVYTDPSPIEIVSNPTADFSYKPNYFDLDLATVDFTNLSSDYTSSLWDFGKGESSIEDNPSYDYYEYGNFYTTLIVTNDYGCKDTIQILIENPAPQEQHLFVPNAVYPSDDNYEVSHFLPKGIRLKKYQVQIYDNWNNLIWESRLLDKLGRPLEAWDATYRGKPVQQDVYIWKIAATFEDGSIWDGKEYPNGKIKKSGTVTIIR